MSEGRRVFSFTKRPGLIGREATGGWEGGCDSLGDNKATVACSSPGRRLTLVGRPISDDGWTATESSFPEDSLGVATSAISGGGDGGVGEGEGEGVTWVGGEAPPLVISRGDRRRQREARFREKRQTREKWETRKVTLPPSDNLTFDYPFLVTPPPPPSHPIFLVLPTVA